MDGKAKLLAESLGKRRFSGADYTGNRDIDPVENVLGIRLKEHRLEGVWPTVLNEFHARLKCGFTASYRCYLK